MQGVTKVLLVLLALAAAKRKPSVPHGSKLIFQWTQMEGCPPNPSPNDTATFRYLRNGDVFADSIFNVIIPAKGINKVRQIITSCREDGSACEHFMTWDSPMDGCAFIAEKKAVWSPAFTNIRPAFLCPIATGRYVNLNWTIDKDLLNLLPFPRNHLYKDRLEMWNEKDELFWCYVLQFVFKLHKPRN